MANPEQQVFDAMMDGWRNQQLSRGLREQTIQNRVATVARFREFADKPPWKWTVADVDEFTREATDRRLALSTLRHHHGAIRGFCDYLTNPLYDWMEICEREFGEIPSQVCLPWNTVAHRLSSRATESAGRSPTTRWSACSTPLTPGLSCS
ncbi:phage integrase N-terminal SAM-like domain-containing protein [uncultured Microbacterium sp.]|uniref:phage integrase N-terminal SAM-like domain-containing protein n=1 Tax=uncultured Microbacterium sp. TaxID=191216 RepID=UPI0025E1D840|nr:phage integrase N-terminal SAM-like domain-containing protein [uncultured Microbacterium sp.]